MKTKPYLLHALSPLHAGTGQAVGVIDLPIARMRSTDIPIVPGSSIKGVLRDAHKTDVEPAKGDDEAAKKNHEELLAVFGPDTDHAADHAGALVVGDARLLALPVRSFKGTFAWVSSPLLLDLTRRDLGSAAPPTVSASDRRLARVPSMGGDGGSLNVHGKDKDATVFLEDLDFPAAADASVAAWAAFLAPFVAPTEKAFMFARRFVVVDDEAMTFLWETATQIDTRVRITPETRTVATGALWTEESLPPETLLIGVMGAERARRPKVDLDADKVLEKVLPADANPTVLQFGGKATVGRGRCRLVPLDAKVQR